jgi:hypothetical protein
MLKFKPKAFNPLSAIAVLLKKFAHEIYLPNTSQQIAPVGLAAILGLTGGSWLTASLIAPQSAQAYTARVNVAINREVGESFQSFLRRAESVARAAAQRSFDRDILVTDVAVTVVGQNDGAVVPLFSLEVSRPAWRRRPDPQQWITYFPDTQSLLGFEDTAEQPGTPPGGFPPAVPPPLPTPDPAISPALPTPSGPRVIELPGGNIRVVPEAPAQQPPTTPAPQGTPAAPGNNQNNQPNNQPNNQQNNQPNNQIPEIPGAPIERIPLPPPTAR